MKIVILFVIGILLISGCKNTQKSPNLDNKGIGPIKEVIIAERIDKTLVKQGEAIFKSKCTTCHHTDKDFVGPKMVQITEKRSPEWIMNMILNPEEMLQKDAIAQELLRDYNGVTMSNQHLTQEEARAILEFLRTL
ncbi:c-type cytochrome [Capnocytophaga canimorsus]|uniref:c-type cytochrome n=1 Tax=Capnocytophaga canimorsus TaxID=28188 RepID=UPI0037D4FE90